VTTTLGVEFFGVPRQRAGAPEAKLTLARNDATLGDVLRELGERFPRLAGECLEPDGRLKPGYVVNLDGERFVGDPRTPLAGVKTILFLSADAGG
jgi:molybdopterin converting factor small subunit